MIFQPANGVKRFVVLTLCNIISAASNKLSFYVGWQTATRMMIAMLCLAVSIFVNVKNMEIYSDLLGSLSATTANMLAIASNMIAGSLISIAIGNSITLRYATGLAFIFGGLYVFWVITKTQSAKLTPRHNNLYSKEI